MLYYHNISISNQYFEAEVRIRDFAMTSGAHLHEVLTYLKNLLV